MRIRTVWVDHQSPQKTQRRAAETLPAETLDEIAPVVQRIEQDLLALITRFHHRTTVVTSRQLDAAEAEEFRAQSKSELSAAAETLVKADSDRRQAIEERERCEQAARKMEEQHRQQAIRIEALLQSQQQQEAAAGAAQGKIGELREALGTLHGREEAMAAAARQLQSSLADKEAQCTAQEKQLRSMRDESHEHAASLAKCDAERQAATQLIDPQAHEIGTLNEALRDLRAQFEECRHEAANAREQVAELRGRLIERRGPSSPPADPAP